VVCPGGAYSILAMDLEGTVQTIVEHRSTKTTWPPLLYESP